ncbi:MAG: hypothetical protein HY650_09170 [Acidobacteria bacterium]|nr:hypothetical protein [Acidobacteriota bacterium]
MIDIHCHILPALDDGPRSLEESVRLLEMLRTEGVTLAVATTHVLDHRYPSPTAAQIDEGLRAVREADGGKLEVVGGAEVRLTPDILDLLDRPELFVNGGRYMLVELPSTLIPVGTENLLFGLTSAGVKPIIAHPERNRMLLKHPERLREFVRMGCTGQLDAPCLMGSGGSELKRTALKWLGEGLVHFVASDAHRPGWRAPLLAEPYEVIRRELGEDLARAVLIDNPRAAVENQELSHIPEVAPERRRRGWFTAWFGAS